MSFIELFIPWFKPEPFKIPIPGFGELPIHPFGMLVATGVILGSKIAEWQARRKFNQQPGFFGALPASKKPEQVFDGIVKPTLSDFVTYTVFTGFVMSHVLDAIFYHPDEVAADPLYLLKIWAGLSSFGGFAGGVMGAWLWKWRRKAKMLPYCDVVAFGLPFGWIFGRTGCFVVHDHPGAVTNFFLAVAPYKVGAQPWLPRHDLGLYEIFWALACSAVLLVLQRKPKPVGFYCAFIILAYTPVRFFLDFLRADADTGGDLRYFGWTPGQFWAIGFFLTGAIMMWKFYQKRPA